MYKVSKRGSPCLFCDRVKDTKNCENKLCKEWQSWFISQWETMRAGVRKSMLQQKTVEVGVSVGGKKFSHPDHVQLYLRADPCQTCVCPESLCETPCTVRKTWNEQREKTGA